MTRLFGTNGIRGVVNQDMNSMLALEIGQAWGTYLKKTIPRPKCAIGTDARLSNHMLKSAVTAGLLSTGCDVVDVGLIPTPTLQYTVKETDFSTSLPCQMPDIQTDCCPKFIDQWHNKIKRWELERLNT